MDKKLFSEYSLTGKGGLTVGRLREIIADFPDDMVVAAGALTEYLPVSCVEETEYNVYPICCEGVPKGREKCLGFKW